MTNEELAAAIDSLNISSEQLKSYIAESGSALNVRPDLPNTITTSQVEIPEDNVAVPVTDLALPGRLIIKPIALKNPYLCVGGAAVSDADGFRLALGETLTLDLEDMSRVYLRGGAYDTACVMALYQSAEQKK